MWQLDHGCGEFPPAVPKTKDGLNPRPTNESN